MTKRLNDRQLAAIALLAQPKRAGLTYDQVAERVGVSRQALYDWRKDDAFNAVLKREIVANTIDDLPDIMASFKEHIVRDGNAALARVLFQAHGMLTDKLEIDNKPQQSGDDHIADMKARIEQMRGQ
ncbi:phBC6A51 family helix-turn-helix protein [Sporosarcina sp. OR05]|uniref:phBC6A51 family helix-turn-helix protein n=1 Tax=Sporosarcina sp. OR05 TaxID=2969819 RepID=UPI00352BCFED